MHCPYPGDAAVTGVLIAGQWEDVLPGSFTSNFSMGSRDYYMWLSMDDTEVRTIRKNDSGGGHSSLIQGIKFDRLVFEETLDRLAGDKDVT